MTDELIALTGRLSEVLTEETALLDALDLAGAGAMLAQKHDALAALQGVMAGGRAMAGIAEGHHAMLRESLAQLTVAGEANRTALERGLALQMRLIDAIAQAVPRARASESPVYRHDGSQLPPRPPEAFAFLSRM